MAKPSGTSSRVLAALRVALRNLRNDPGYTAAAVVTLAVTTRAMTAIFSAVHAILLNPGGIHAPEAMERLLAGVALGLLLAAAASRVLRGLLFGVTPLDATTYMAVTLLVSSAVMTAAYVAASRGAGAGALESLRCE